ncbi:MAG TPA: hypothetical protein VGO00_26175, partial [Kofleriaceae bacterium]|nr:hypothetical protein [Kofleriaceae bacterium]
LAVVLSGCGGCGNDSAAPDAAADADTSKPFTECAGDPQSFVRQAFVALDGRRPLGQAETDVYVDLYTAAVAQGRDPKDTVARAMMARPEFVERWIDTSMDSLHVQRVDIQSEASCWDQPGRTVTDGSLAAMMRDKPATSTGDGQLFTMVDVARSSILLDDLSPMYRAQMFSMVYHPIPAANVAPAEAELARRSDFGDTFDSAYLHRDTVCLGCHNSEHSVTDNDDPALDRFWPVRGLPEKGVYGDSTGVAEDRAHAAFRVDNFVDGGSKTPWGWASSCGVFASSVSDSVAPVDAKLASVTGTRATVFDLEAALGRGFAALRGTGPTIGPDGAIADPDAALAWLVTLKVTEDVWKQATGTALTIANYFPRNQASGELLDKLATTFATSGYSLKTLLSAIVETDYFNRQPPELACGSNPYTYPNVFDPWVIADADPAKRLNGPGDAVAALDARTLVTATSAALDWALPPGASRFPDYGEPNCVGTCADLSQDCGFGQCCVTFNAVCTQHGLSPDLELPFERGVGMFLRNSERGFRGLDFQARLVWEDRYGACTRPPWVTADAIDAIIAAAAADPTATATDVISALKDRITGEPAITAGAEHDALAAMVGSLDGPATGVTAAALRDVCGALLESPQFLLSGIAGRGGARPKLTPTAAGYDAVCADLALRGIGIAGLGVTCSPLALVPATSARIPVARSHVNAVPIRRGKPVRR